MSREAEEGPDPSGQDEGARLSDWLLAPIRASQMPPPPKILPPAEPEVPAAGDSETAHDDEALVVAGAAPRGKAWVLVGALCLVLLGALLVFRSLSGRSAETSPSSPGAGPGPADLAAGAPAGDDVPPPPPEEIEDPESAGEVVANEPSVPERTSTAVEPGPASSAPGGPSVGRFPDLPWSILRTLGSPAEDEP